MLQRAGRAAGFIEQYLPSPAKAGWLARSGSMRLSMTASGRACGS
jgi:hypothetical protein